MKSLVSLLVHLLQDESRRCDVPVTRDVETLRRRCRHEGDSFITITLAAYCAGFERSLDEGRLVPGSFGPFGALATGTPKFLQGFLYRVFDKETGDLLAAPAVDCIRAVRQICLFGKKVVRPCTPARLKAATQAYVDCDESVELSPTGKLWDRFGAVADILISDIALGEDVLDEITPDHGPGATQEGVLGNAKWRFETWFKRLDDVGITFQRFAKGISSEAPDDSCKPETLEPEDEPPVKVVFVPKTLKTPRVIAVEPVCMQFVQQGLARYLVGQIERSSLCRGRVNFRDQGVNQDLALRASADGSLATMDMSEASDRVSMAHYQRLFASHPQFRGLVDACRSMRAKLPDGRIIPLRKFASMGSALCFPVEALVFYTSIIASRLVRAGHYPTRAAVHKMSRAVYVYGDDLIVPADETSAIREDLEALGFKVNIRKSFGKGKFRESCGMDAYDGEAVTPTYLRRDVPTNRGDASGIVSTVATANQLYQLGLYKTAAALRKAVEDLIGTLPTVRATSPAVGWHATHSMWLPPTRWNKRLMRWEHLVWVPTTPRLSDPLEGEAALSKCYRKIGSPSIDREHLEMTPRRYALALKRSWVCRDY
jgi:hypothetical protein